MLKIRFGVICVAALTLFAEAPVPSQAVKPINNFLIAPNRPLVYLKFDQHGKGIPRSKEESNARFWFRFTNNCEIPITVNTTSVPDGSPKNEQGLMYEVVWIPRAGPPLGEGFKAGELPKIQGGSEQVRIEDMPNGTMSEVGSFQSIPPGGELLFSIPINHLAQRWNIEIPFEFDLPKVAGKGLRDPNVWGGQPKMALSYFLWDLPPEVLSQVQRN